MRNRLSGLLWEVSKESEYTAVNGVRHGLYSVEL